MVVPGFHKVINTWWEEVLQREKDNLNARKVSNHNGNCLKTNDIFTASDKKVYSDFIPAICGPGDIRISRAEIIYGSASNKQGRADSIRWVVNPCFVAIQADHETLDVPECGTWTSVAASHSDLLASSSTPSGQTNIHGRPMERFPASVLLHHKSHLSDALIGQCRWDDPLARGEAELVLGGSDHGA